MRGGRGDPQQRYENDEPISDRVPRLWGWKPILLGGIAVVTIIGTCFTRSKSLDVSSDDIQTIRMSGFEENVLASGHIVPLHVTVVTTMVAGRVEIASVHRGDTVAQGTQLLLLENPELAIAALEAERIAISANEDAIKDVSQARLLVKESEQHLIEGNGALRDARQAVVEAEYMVPRQLLPVVEKPRREDLLAAALARARSDSMVLQLAKADLARRIVRAPIERQLTENLRLRHRAQIAALTVRAPVAGVLQDFEVMPGAWLNPGQTVASIIGDGGLGARLEVYEADAARLATGQPVRILVQNDTVMGTIDRIAPAARDGRVLIEVNLDASKIGLRPESSVNGEIVVTRAQNVAVVRRPSWIRTPGSYQMLCTDSSSQTANACRIDVIAVGRTSMIVDPHSNGTHLIIGGAGPPYSASRYRLR